ncbi:MAG: hypothetical protein LBI41_00860 [Lactobacillales bacterium]|jgi:hypothetical protein|nr:hypothetical protein [Lactobacillales bacterium]
MLRNIFFSRKLKSISNKIAGENIFYVIRRECSNTGLLSDWHNVLGHIMYAVENGLIPTVDMQNYKTSYHEKDPVNGISNAWEYYFQQPTSSSLEDAYKSKGAVILSSLGYIQEEVPSDFRFIYDKNMLKKHNYYISKYMKLRPEVNKYVKISEKEIFKEKKILGVFYRGTDYNYAKGHFTPPKPNVLLAKVRELFLQWGMEWIFLVTEEEEVVKIFKNEFNTKVIITDSSRVKSYSKEMGAIANFKKDNNYLKNLNYLRDIILLSKCHSLVCSKANGSAAAIEMNNNKYINRFIFELGTN